ncbi:MAG: hypothetical protein GC189_01275 [Alphaproteobacteria bacterium]|nr:hypothetical protein [Alphaproteobacteria bacterium]
MALLNVRPMTGSLALAGALAFIAYGLRRLITGDARHAPAVRNAGPRHMQNPPKRWDDVDERSDESFPASDPPGTY